MRVDRNQSHGSPEFLDFAEALVNLLHAENHPDPKKTLDFACRTFWPGCDIYIGGTHWRVMPSVSLGAAKSFYVDFSTPQPLEQWNPGSLYRPDRIGCLNCADAIQVPRNTQTV